MPRTLGITLLVLWTLLLALALLLVSRHEGLSGLFSGPGLLALLVILALMAVGLLLLASTLLLCQALWPAQVVRSRRRLEAFPTRCALTGLLVILLQVWLVTLSPVPLRPLLLLSWVLWDSLALAQGLPALATLCGERCGWSGLRSTAVGTALLACGSVLPVVGWGLAAGYTLQCVGTHFMIGRLGDRP